MAREKTGLQYQTSVVLLAIALILLSSCSSSNDSAAPDSSGDNATTSPNTNNASNSEVNLSENSSEQSDSTITDADADVEQVASVPVNSDALVQLLLTDYIVNENQVVPTSSWICTDVFNQNRALYFFSAGVLDAGRNVLVERTLYDNDTFNDIAFFWSVSANDAIVISSATLPDESETLLSTGQQYDVSSIRFFEVESRRSFTAHSVLRGQITCALFDIQ